MYNYLKLTEVYSRLHMNRKFRRDYGVYCCPHVFKQKEPILLVVRDPEDGDYQFLCGCDVSELERPHLVCVSYFLDNEPALEQFANLEPGTGAERESVQHDWEFFELE